MRQMTNQEFIILLMIWYRLIELLLNSFLLIRSLIDACKKWMNLQNNESTSRQHRQVQNFGCRYIDINVR